MNIGRGLIDVSVIICTFNRAETLRVTLNEMAAVSSRTLVRHEIIVIDNASTDATAEVIRDFAAVLPIAYVLETRKGAAAARNAGLEKASGRCIFIIDDDCIPGDDWFEVGAGLLQHDPRQLFGGWIGLHDERDLPLTIKLDNTPARLSGTGDLFGFIHGCNMIFGRCVLDEIGLFDPLLGPGSSCKAADDTDLIYRAFHAGVPVRYDPTLRVFHNHGRRDPLAGASLERSYEISIGALVFKHALQGRLDMVKALHWRISRDRGHTVARKLQLARGAAAYARALVQHWRAWPRPRGVLRLR